MFYRTESSASLTLAGTLPYPRMPITRGIATFTLDEGRCPKWLFERMVKLGREMTRALVGEFGPDEFVRRIADPVWFQSLGTVLAFDWNASGLTTILTAALKEALRGEERELGIFICGGKGKTSRKTPEHITEWGRRLEVGEAETQALVYNSKMSAKVDSALVQDGYQLYHHSFFFSLRRGYPRPETSVSSVEPLGPKVGPARVGAWAVVQQGMNAETATARRYHWFSENIYDLVCEPHAGIASQARHRGVLNLVAKTSQKTRDLSVELVEAGYRSLMKDIAILRRHASSLSKMIAFEHQPTGEQLTLLKLEDVEFKTHPVVSEDFSKSAYLEKVLAKATALRPRTYEELVALEGVGPKTVRALALVAEVIYGAQPSYEDPARYSFAHGGKDSTPYPVNRKTYDRTIAILQAAVRRSRLEAREKEGALQRLNAMHTAPS